MKKVIAGLVRDAILCIAFFGCGCSNLVDVSSGAIGFRKADENELSIVSWNLQTFFDAVDTGNEYEEFTGKKSKWTEAKYKERLERLCAFMKAVNADIFCFMEVENTAVVQDIANTLQIGVSGMSWRYVSFARESGASLGCAVFSRYMMESLTVHSLNCKAAVPLKAFSGYSAGEELTQPSMRPLMELRFSFGGTGSGRTAEPARAAGSANGDEGIAGSGRRLALFVAHWKSKSGGAKESEVWRNCQEAVLSGRIEQALADGYSVAACGDFNRELSEFMYSRTEGCVDLRGNFNIVTVRSPWFSSSAQGSYCYQNVWNRIDHFFFAGDIACASFAVYEEDDFVTASGLPNEYDVWTGTGYSDHLPISCRLQL
jgi:endonuclease/exonuclease/phosphatase family metal-dependent hydrolase